MTILAVAQICAKRLGLTSPSAFVGSTDNNIVLLEQMMLKALQEIRDEFAWPELQREYLFDIATSTESYALPADYNFSLSETFWNRDRRWPIDGPTTPQEWQLLKSGLVATFPNQRFRVKGRGTTQFFIDPTPTSDDNTHTLVFEYISRTFVRPKTWVTATSWSGIRYCFYNGNIYDRGGTGAGTTGATPPTHTSGAVSDGGITWTYTDAAFEAFNHDSDELVLDQQMIVDATVWRFKEETGFDYQLLFEQAQVRKEEMKAKLQSASILSIRRGSLAPGGIGSWSYPVSGYLE